MFVDFILDVDMIMLNGNSFGYVLFVLYMLFDNRFNLEWLWWKLFWFYVYCDYCVYMFIEI